MKLVADESGLSPACLQEQQSQVPLKIVSKERCQPATVIHYMMRFLLSEYLTRVRGDHTRCRSAGPRCCERHMPGR